jgi:hypothetical protein
MGRNQKEGRRTPSADSSGNSYGKRRAVLDKVSFHGHPNVSALHPTTIEITMDEHLTERGDCIIGTGANKGCADLHEELKDALKTNGTNVRIRILVEPYTFEVHAKGDSRLTLSNRSDMVIRRSNFISDRTVSVNASHAAVDIPRPIVERLKDELQIGILEIEVTSS